ncbi:MAG: RNA methyltransferase [Acidimicrobiia bacterium]
MSEAALGPRHSDVKRLRELLRDARARDAEQTFVVEGPRAVAAALERGARLEHVYLGPNADTAFAPLVEQLDRAGVARSTLKEGVLERVGSTVTPQPVLAIAPKPTVELTALARDGLVLVGARLSDPGNVGALLRSADAAGAAGIVLGTGSVDAYNPKVVRASAGAIFGVPILEGWSVMDALQALREAGRTCLGTRAGDGTPYHQVDLTAPTAVVLGNEAHGLGAGVADGLDRALDGWITIPMHGPTESLNVAMAGTVVCFEASRQRANQRHARTKQTPA